ncbi:MAG: type II toxin-antitoxin system RelE/ParE family toxin [Dehalococcoidia bacterium]
MKVLLTEPAELHLDKIREFVGATSPRFADELVERIRDRMKQIAEFPESGRLVPGAEALSLREVFESSYRIIYVVARDHIEVLGIIHGRRDLL